MDTKGALHPLSFLPRVGGCGPCESKMDLQVARLVGVIEKTSGRDKLCRLLQYGSKFVYWLLELESLSPELIKKLRALESSISTARKR